MASEKRSPKDADFTRAFLAEEKQVRINTGKLACALVCVLMPLGTTVDGWVYPEHRWEFLTWRLMCSALVGVIWLLHYTRVARAFYPLLGMPIVILPAFFMSLMMYHTQGAASPYYAALNLILLAVSAVGHWSMAETFFAVGSVICLYLGTYVLKGSLKIDFPIFFTNFYFILLTGIIVSCGNYLFNRLRFREFSLRYELDGSRRQLQQTNQKLLELDQIKSRFFANISHELRTPLTLLIAPLENLLRRFDVDEETKALLATMHSNGMRLLKLINDLLDLVRLESGRMEAKREPLAVPEFIRGLASAARQVADDKRIRLEPHVEETLGTVLADRDKLEKILLNLVFNALKFTAAGGRVDLRAAKQGENFVLTVADTGMGISQKNLPFVFDRFWQGDGTPKRKYQGVGIGLALVKELTEVQGGTVSVESEEGRGTTFTVRLPYEEAPPVPLPTTPADQGEGSAAGGHEATVASEEWLSNLYRRAELFPALTPVQRSIRPVEAPPGGKKPTVLIADDEPDMLRFLRSQLSREYQVFEAVDGQQAVEKATQFLPDIVLLDMMMPEKDGLQACRELREHTSTQSIPIVLLTARADEETKLAALSAGASDFLPKPFSVTELHIRIKNLVESYHYQRTLSKQKKVLESTIEQLKETETQLVQSEKLASLGRMSAGIIHEINNPLNFATTGLFTLRNKGKYVAPEQQEEYREILKDVEEGITRVKNIVSDLRMFTHPETESRDQVDVAEVVAAALRFLSNEWKNKVQIVQSLDANQAIWGNKNKLIHILVNLLQNSLDALRARNGEQDKPTIWIEGKTEPGKSVLVVRDNGPGIDSAHLDKIFDPFYTTKDVGDGMGLGLAICYRIVQDYGGRISVRTEQGKFCQFTLEFPDKG